MENSTKTLRLLLVLSLLILAAAAGSAQSTILSVDTLNVLDASGSKVAKVLGMDTNGWKIALRVKKNLLIFNVLPAGFYGTDSVLFFNSFDCSGTALFYAASAYGSVGIQGDAPRSSVVGTQVYIPTGDQQLTTPNSVLLISVGGVNVCSVQQGITDYYRPASVLVDLGAQFSAPFKVVGAAAQ